MDEKKLQPAMEDSAYEIEHVSAKERAAAAHRASLAKAKEAQIDNSKCVKEGRDHSFLTADGKGVPHPSVDRNEQEWMRLMMFLVARGYSNKEIAAKLNKKEAYVSQVRRQPWFREQLEATIESEGLNSLREVLNGELLNSVYTLIDIRDDTKAKGSERVAAANSLIDRVLGKAPQTVNHVDGGRTEAAVEQSRLEAQLREVDEQLRIHGVIQPTQSSNQPTSNQ